MNHYIDAHCHIDLYKTPSEVVKQINQSKTYTIAVTNSPTVFEYTESLIFDSPFIKAAVGLHPQLAAERRNEVALFDEILMKTRFVGEVGLDYTTRDTNNRSMQRSVLETILDKCSSYEDKVVSLHSRRATADVLAIVGHNFRGTTILHWFSGTYKELDRAIEQGFHFSVNAAMMKSKHGIEICSRIPRDKVLTESDGPFIGVPNNPTMPTDLPNIVSNLSALWSCSFKEAQITIFDTYNKLTGPFP